EDTATLDRHGKVVDTEGTWHAGVDGAQPGVFMQAHPQLGRKFRQEWYRGQAEDVFKVVDRSAAVTVPYGRFRHALRTEETNALEPNVLDNKYYVRGIGDVADLAVKRPPAPRPPSGPPAGVTRARFELWTRRLLADAAARDSAAVKGDVTTLAWIRD